MHVEAVLLDALPRGEPPPLLAREAGVLVLERLLEPEAVFPFAPDLVPRLGGSMMGGWTTRLVFRVGIVGRDGGALARCRADSDRRDAHAIAIAGA